VTRREEMANNEPDYVTDLESCDGGYSSQRDPGRRICVYSSPADPNRERQHSSRNQCEHLEVLGEENACKQAKCGQNHHGEERLPKIQHSTTIS